uniref:Uncharacterized protein n=1 Tax=Arundo donax TaxID=35708 RepID=A0A0A9C7M6_ARUDO
MVHRGCLRVIFFLTRKTRRLKPRYLSLQAICFASILQLELHKTGPN